MVSLRTALLVWLGMAVAAAQPPRLTRVYPLGGQAGTVVSVEVLGERLSNVSRVQFDSPDIEWKSVTFASPHRLVGTVAIAATAAHGLHSLRVLTVDGPSNSGLFQVGAFPAQQESEPNDRVEGAVPIHSFPVDLHGRLDTARDMDVFAFAATAGQRLVFDLKSIEDGSAVEARMLLLDSSGKQIAFNDDRDDYNENPRIEHTFATAGKYFLKLDQYRGPRGFNFGKLCAYILRIGSLPLISSVEPRALRSGSSETVRLRGTGLTYSRGVYISEMRQAEYSRMTYPYTMPIHFRADPAGATLPRIEGKLKVQAGDTLEAEFTIPESARPGLWRIWVTGSNGPLDAGVLELTRWPVWREDRARAGALDASQVAISGSLTKAGEKDQYQIRVRAGEPLQFWTMAEQMGVAHLDSVLTLRDSTGRKLAGNDDVVAGQGTLLGNPDSRFFFTPEADGVLILEVRDRTGRGGAGFEYLVKVDAGKPGFQLFTTPENFTVARGEVGQLKVHLVREPGFQGEVDVWIDGLPDGAVSTRGRFRSDQLFEPNADGADMVIPELTLSVTAPSVMPSGEYKVRVFGAPAAEPSGIIEAHSTLTLGPLLDAWNFVRRPLPAVTMTVVEPCAARLSSSARSLQVEQGASVMLQLNLTGIAREASFRLLDLPRGLQYRVSRRDENQVELLLAAEAHAAAGTYEISAEAESSGRRVPSGSLMLTVKGSPAQ